MMALTLKHPWPYAICFLGKRIENRTWRPRPSQLQPGSYLAIHGGVIPKGRALTEASDDLQRLKAQGLCPDHVTLEETIMPGIVAVCLFGDVVMSSPSPWFHGPFGWRLGHAFVLAEPVAHVGAQGLWRLQPEMRVEVDASYQQAKRRFVKSVG
jgi:hypothetical protein